MKYIIEFDTNLKKIIVDEETSDCCQMYSFLEKGDIPRRGYGYICSTRDICLKHLKAEIKKEIKCLKKELKDWEKALSKIEKSDKQ